MVSLLLHSTLIINLQLRTIYLWRHWRKNTVEYLKVIPWVISTVFWDKHVVKPFWNWNTFIFDRHTYLIKVYSIIFTYFFRIPKAFVHLFLPVWHIRPVKPGEQKQENMLTPSLHVPPWWQGWLEHSSMSALKKKEKWQINNNNCIRIQMMMMTLTFRKTDIFKERYYIPINLYNSWKFVIMIRKYTSYIN